MSAAAAALQGLAVNEATAPASRNGNGRVRCGIYTRKSHEQGLDQAFNSLQAQREACEAYIASQKHEGWMALPNPYDDGGVSGATMDRPALQRLLADIQGGRIDVIVVYKVDRLTRALSDFARIVEVLERYEVSFVSVTQVAPLTGSAAVPDNPVHLHRRLNSTDDGTSPKDRPDEAGEEWKGGWLELSGSYHATGLGRLSF